MIASMTPRCRPSSVKPDTTFAGGRVRSGELSVAPDVNVVIARADEIDHARAALAHSSRMRCFCRCRRVHEARPRLGSDAVGERDLTGDSGRAELAVQGGVAS